MATLLFNNNNNQSNNNILSDTYVCTEHKYWQEHLDCICCQGRAAYMSVEWKGYGGPSWGYIISMVDQYVEDQKTPEQKQKEREEREEDTRQGIISYFLQKQEFRYMKKVPVGNNKEHSGRKNKKVEKVEVLVRIRRPCKYFCHKGVYGAEMPGDRIYPSGCTAHKNHLCPAYHPDEPEWNEIVEEDKQRKLSPPDKNNDWRQGEQSWRSGNKSHGGKKTYGKSGEEKRY